MKILFVSMHSVHSSNWIKSLIDSGFKVYWFDINSQGAIEISPTIKQFTNWSKRFVPHIKGEYFLSKNFPLIYNFIRPALEVIENKALENIIKEIQPDVIHSFEMQTCCYPILKTMNKFPAIKWIYSCWGSDLYYYKQFPKHLKKIKPILNRVNFLYTDCMRDFVLAKELGFKGLHTGVIPGGTGYDLQAYSKYKIPIKDRKIILLKGYQHLFGRALTVIKAIQELKNELKDYEIVVFGAHPSVINFVTENKMSIQVFHRHELSQLELMKLMGKSLIYIGNSISDGMPNTLLEAIVMGAFPIQSNPGGASGEIIKHGENGLLIKNAESTAEIKKVILQATSNQLMIKAATHINMVLSQERLDYETNKNKILKMYKIISKCSL